MFCAWRPIAKPACGRCSCSTILARRAFGAISVRTLDGRGERTLATRGKIALTGSRATFAATWCASACAFVARCPLERAALVGTAAACAKARALRRATFTRLSTFVVSRAFSTRTGVEAAAGARAGWAAGIVCAARATRCAKCRAAGAFVAGEACWPLAFSAARRAVALRTARSAVGTFATRRSLASLTRCETARWAFGALTVELARRAFGTLTVQTCAADVQCAHRRTCAAGVRSARRRTCAAHAQSARVATSAAPALRAPRQTFAVHPHHHHAAAADPTTYAVQRH